MIYALFIVLQAIGRHNKKGRLLRQPVPDGLISGQNVIIFLVSISFPAASCTIINCVVIVSGTV